MKINAGKCEAIIFRKALFKNPLGYFLSDRKTLETSNCIYFGIILRSDLNWVD
jgi:hypothetical protein